MVETHLSDESQTPQNHFWAELHERHSKKAAQRCTGTRAWVPPSGADTEGWGSDQQSCDSHDDYAEDSTSTKGALHYSPLDVNLPVQDIQCLRLRDCTPPRPKGEVEVEADSDSAAGGGCMLVVIEFEGGGVRLRSQRVRFVFGEGFKVTVTGPGMHPRIWCADSDADADAVPPVVFDPTLVTALRSGSSPRPPPTTPTEREGALFEEPESQI